MPVHYFSLADGSMEVHEDRIVFEDEAAKRRVGIIVLVGSMCALYIAKFVLAYSKNNHEDMFFALVFVGLGLLAFIFRYQDLRRVVKQVSIKEIVSVKFIHHRFFKRHEMIFRLKNGRIRRVAIGWDASDHERLCNLFPAKGIRIEN